MYIMNNHLKVMPLTGHVHEPVINAVPTFLYQHPEMRLEVSIPAGSGKQLLANNMAGGTCIRTGQDIKQLWYHQKLGVSDV